jgi:hypothetical protein
VNWYSRGALGCTIGGRQVPHRPGVARRCSVSASSHRADHLEAHVLHFRSRRASTRPAEPDPVASTRGRHWHYDRRRQSATVAGRRLRDLAPESNRPSQPLERTTAIRREHAPRCQLCRVLTLTANLRIVVERQSCRHCGFQVALRARRIRRCTSRVTMCAVLGSSPRALEHGH